MHSESPKPAEINSPARQGPDSSSNIRAWLNGAMAGVAFHAMGACTPEYGQSATDTDTPPAQACLNASDQAGVHENAVAGISGDVVALAQNGTITPLFSGSVPAYLNTENIDACEGAVLTGAAITVPSDFDGTDASQQSLSFFVVPDSGESLINPTDLGDERIHVDPHFAQVTGSNLQTILGSSLETASNLSNDEAPLSIMTTVTYSLPGQSPYGAIEFHVSKNDTKWENTGISKLPYVEQGNGFGDPVLVVNADKGTLVYQTLPNEKVYAAPMEDVHSAVELPGQTGTPDAVSLGNGVVALYTPSERGLQCTVGSFDEIAAGSAPSSEITFTIPNGYGNLIGDPSVVDFNPNDPCDPKDFSALVKIQQAD